MGSRIIGTGMYVPVRTLTNIDLEKMIETSDTWIRERTGIQERRIAEPGTPNSDMCLEASRLALEKAGRSPSTIDVIIVATVTPDMPLPSTGCFLQAKLGATNACAMDINAACSGFIYALSVGDAMIRAGRAKTALVVGAEILSTVVDYRDRNTCILFGDGAGAVVLEECPDGEGLLCCDTRSDGRLWDLIYCPAGGTVNPTTPETVENRMGFIRMNGNETFKHAVTRMVEVSAAVLSRYGFTGDDVSLFIPHQANMRIITAVGKRLKIPIDRVFVDLERYGNTSAASIPIALAEAYEAGRIREGDLVLLAAFGAGLTWGSALFRA